MDAPAALLLLSIGDAEVRALDPAMPRVASPVAAADAAHARVGEAAGIDDPVLALGTTRYSPKQTTHITATLPWLGQQYPLVRAARDDASAADAVAEGARAQLRLDVDRAWIDLWLAERERDLAEDAATAAGRVAASAHARLDAGDVPELTALLADADASRARAEAADGEAKRMAAAATLGALVGAPADALATTGDPSLPADLPPLDSWLTKLGDAPAAVADAHGVEAARERQAAARADWLPRLEADVGREAGDPGLPGTDYLATAGFAVPIGGRHGPAVREARANADQAAADAASARAEREAAVTSAWWTVRAGIDRLAVFDREAVPAADRAASLTEEAFAAGEGDIESVIATRRSAEAVHGERAQAAADLAAAWAELEAAVGGPDAG